MRVELTGVTVRNIISDITLDASGEVVGIVGPNGSGKSTTLRCVYRALKPDAGTVLLDGENVHKRHDVARHLAALTQESQVEFDFTVAEVVEMGRLPHGRDPLRDSRVVSEALATVDVSHLAARSFLSLSGGERQRVLIARAIAQEPRVLVLDEPTNHLDIRHQLDVLGLARSLGITVLTVLHDLNLAASYCDRLYVLDEGRIVASGTPSEVLVPELIAKVFHVTAHVVRHPTTGVPQLLFDQEVTPLRTVVLAAVLLVSGCGATVAQDPSASDPVTVTNCGQQVTFDKIPSKVVTNDTGITELMFALGLKDRMAGYVVSGVDTVDVRTSPWKADFESVKHLSDKVSKEVVQGANADLVFAGWNYGFSESTGFTPDALKALGIGTYQLTEACRNGVGKQRGIMPALDALYTDLRNLGKIFRVEAKAEELVKSYQQQIENAGKLMAGKPRPKVFLYDSGQDQPFTSGKNAAPQDVISKAGGDNIFGDLNDSWTTVNWETVVQRDPDVVLIVDYADGEANTPEQKQAFLEGFAPLANSPAVKNKRFFSLPYAALVESPRNAASIEAFAKFLSQA